MKKILLSAIMLTALSFASFADDVKKEDVKNINESSDEKITPSTDSKFGCSGGQTTCGLTYMVCDNGGEWTAQESWIIYSIMNQQLCGEAPN
ncbi:MAG: hypothetical protein H7098_13240 [Oligoflexus sp.]|nr:hypothetical protein [Pseudopedobacter sp.]